jgi:hypothetical protein
MPRNWEAEEIDREYISPNPQIATNLTVTLLNAAHHVARETLASVDAAWALGVRAEKVRNSNVCRT